jgi:hypothetical protein
LTQFNRQSGRVVAGPDLLVDVSAAADHQTPGREKRYSAARLMQQFGQAADADAINDR